MGEEFVAIFAIAVVFSPLYLWPLLKFMVEWRKAGHGGKDVEQLRQEFQELRREFERSKGDQNDAILGLNRAFSHLEQRLDGYAGIDAPAPAPEVPGTPPKQKQL